MPNTTQDLPRQLIREKWGNLANLALYSSDLVRPRIRSFGDVRKFLSASGNYCLLLNQEICDYDDWNVDNIDIREEDLLSYFYKIWKPAEEFTEASRKYTKTERKPPSKPKTLEWISAIQSDAYQPIRLNTYSEVKVLSKIKIIERSQVNGIDKTGNKQVLYKSDILSISAASDWPKLRFHVPIHTSLRSSEFDKNLQVDDIILEFAQQHEFPVTAVTRLGREFSGKIKSFDDDAIYLQIKGWQVIVFRPGFLKFVIEGLEGVVKRWGPEDLYGYIEFDDFLPGLPQEILVTDTSLNSRIISQKLQPYLKVKFNLEITQQKNEHSYFETSKVDIVTSEQVYRGEVKLFNAEKGSGILTSRDYSNDVYLHKSQVNRKDINVLQGGYPVEFNIAETTEGQNSAAINVKVIKAKR